MSFELFAEVRMNRRVDKCKDYVSAGGYSILADDKTYNFDFMEYDVTIDREDPAIISIEAKHPDLDVFPLAAQLTPDVFRRINKFLEFFIYTGEPGESDLAPEELLQCQFYFPETDETVYVSDSVCRDAEVTCS